MKDIYSKIKNLFLKTQKLINKLYSTGAIFIVPFLQYLVFHITLKESNNPTCHTNTYYVSAYLLLLIIVFLYLLFQCEKNTDFINKKIGQLKFIISILSVVLTLSFTFGSFYLCLFMFDSNSFINVSGTKFFEQYFNFWYYSLGVFLMNSSSLITPNSITAKLFTLTEMITSFIAIVIILANYKILLDPFNEYLDERDKEKERKGKERETKKQAESKSAYKEQKHKDTLDEERTQD
ncbi:MAG: hypothetical protein PHO12_02940 [Bacteroidales bacterium]|nr:hypothetical protein [Bacteroidales bacterium]MDD4684718.1 hypothetical protein [Bacteroidales bacterium]